MSSRYQLTNPKTKYNFEERRRCPTCGSDDAIRLYLSRFDKGPIGSFVADYYKIDPAILSAAPYELRRCETCSLVYQGFVGGPELLNDLYGAWLDDHCRPEDDPQYQCELADPLQSRDGHEILVAAKFLGLRTEQMVTLDYGMGWALWARIALHLGCASYGSDLAEPRMRYARQQGVQTLEDDEIGAERFHFINTEQVMEHLTDPFGTAARLASALLPGGILKVSVPSAEAAGKIVSGLETIGDDVLSVARSKLMPVQPLEHVNGFTRQSLAILARKLRVELVEPGAFTKYAFLHHKGSISLMRPMKALKELVRPYYQFHNRNNLYVWMQKPLTAGRAFG